MRDAQAGDAAATATIAVLETRVARTARVMLERFRLVMPEDAPSRDRRAAGAAYAHCLDHVRAFLTVARERRCLRPDELEFVRAHAASGARRGVPLTTMLQAYRESHRALFQAIVDAAGATPEGTAAALVLTGRTLEHVDAVTMTLAETHLATRRQIDAGADAARRDLVDRALAGSVDPGAKGADRARALGFDPDAPYVVVVCLPPGDDDHDEAELHALAGRIGRIDSSQGRPAIAVVREGEVVAVVRLLDRTPAGLRASVRNALGSGGRAGISLACRGVPELARGYAEARGALHEAPPDGVASLLEFSSVDYLAATADDTAVRLVDPRIRAALEADATGDGALADTLLAFLDADLSAPTAAEALRVHPNTVYYRLNKLARATGRNPRRFHDLVELLIAVRILRRGAPTPDRPALDGHAGTGR